MVDTYRDFIPAGEDTGAQGNVFKDFVPPFKPEVKTEVKVEKTEKVQEAFKCDSCPFVAKSSFGLQAHKKKHLVK